MDRSRFVHTHITSSKYYGNSEAEFDVNENKNTKRKTETDMRIFLSYLVSVNEPREPEKIPADELDRHLTTYFSVIKKHDGNEYEPASLRGMLCSIERYLRSKNFSVSLTRDAEFANTRNMLKERQKLLREMVKTDKFIKSDALASNTVLRLNQLYLAKEFGPHNPSSVINALCFVFVVNLKIRKAIDHKQLLWGDISLKVSSSNEEYLCYEPLSGFEYCRLPLKGISGHRVMAQKSDTSLWDPITIYKLYRHKRPNNMMSPESPFYLGIAVTLHESLQQPWFKSVAMGVNKLNDLVRMIRDLTGSLGNSPTHVIDLYSARETQDGIVENDYPHKINKYQATLVDKDNEVNDSNDSPVDMSPTGTRCLTNVEKRNKPATADEVKETDDKTDVETECIAAKGKIQKILGSLSTEAKSDVLQWLFPKSETRAGSSRQDTDRRSSTRKRLRVTLELDDGDIDQCASFDKIAKIQVLPEPDTTVTCESTATQLTDKPRHHDEADITSDVESVSDTHEEKDEANDSTQDNAIELRPSQTAKESPKIEFHQPTSPPSPVHIQKLLTNSNTDMDVSNKTTDIKHSMPGYNPYTAWAIDPRFAMFMRNGFIQTYQDFVNIYSNSQFKDTASK